MSEVRKLNTVLFADIAGYTSLMQKDEKNALALLNHFKKILEEIVPKYEGVIVQYFGDGCLLTFDSSTKAVECSIDLQKAFQEKKIPVRVGLHLGEVVYKNNNAFGDGVNIASRVESLGIPGSILLSKSVRDQIKNKSEFQLVRKGSFEFKNVEEAMDIYAVANEGIVIPERGEMIGKTKKRKTNRLVYAGILGLLLISTYLYFDRDKGSTSDLEKSIAVLPFVDMSPTQDQAYLGDGVAEEILNILSKIQELKVIARTSSFQFREEKVDIREISEKLGVNYVLEGSVRKIDNQLRITAQLINSNDGSHIWSENYDDKFEDIFQLQDKIASAISEQLKSSLDLGSDLSPPTKSIDAYENYLKGVHIHHNINPISVSRERFDAAEKFLLRSIELDSTFAEAHAGLSDLYDTGIVVFPSDSSFSRKAQKESTKAISLKPNSSYALLSQALVHYRETELDRSYNLYIQALRSDPNNHYALINFAGLLDDMGLHDQAIKTSSKAISLDPLNLNYLEQRGELYRHVGMLSAATEDFEEEISLGGEFSRIQLFLTHCLAKNVDQANAQLQKIYTDATIDLPPQQNKFLEALLLAAKGDTRATELIEEQTQVFIVNLILGNVAQESEQWFQNFERRIDQGVCCPRPKTIAIDPTPNGDSIYLELIEPILQDSRFPNLYAKYKKCVEENRMKYDLENTFLKDIL